VFAIDVLVCPRGGGRRHIVAVLTAGPRLRALLERLGLGDPAAAPGPSRSPPRSDGSSPPSALASPLPRRACPRLPTAVLGSRSRPVALASSGRTLLFLCYRSVPLSRPAGHHQPARQPRPLASAPEKTIPSCRAGSVDASRPFETPFRLARRRTHPTDATCRSRLTTATKAPSCLRPACGAVMTEQ
jgi:hypothetical protein